jgi:beta-carotene hydroxylase
MNNGQLMLRQPPLHEMGGDLTQISALRRWVSIISPFAWSGGYFVLAALGLWIPAVVCLIVLSFVTYGSVSHDLVHRNLGLSRRANDLLLTVIELLTLRSGTAYRLFSILAFRHLYHLEHHLYPSVPHHNWPKLARRLDPYLTAAGVHPVRLWF